jgi:hypothetical protein
VSWRKNECIFHRLRRYKGSESLLLALELASRIVVRLRITKSAASVNLLGNDGACTFACVEAAAAVGAVGVAGARSGDELLSSTVPGAGVGRRCWPGNGTKRRGLTGGGSGVSGGGDGLAGGGSGRAAPGQALCRAAVRLRVPEPAASINLLGNDGTGTFARVEAAAAVGTFGIAGARSRDELCALADDQQGH